MRPLILWQFALLFTRSDCFDWTSPTDVSQHDVLHGFATLDKSSDFGRHDSLTSTVKDGHRVLKVNYHHGSYSDSSIPNRGTQFYMQPSGVKGHTEMTLSYEVWFPGNSDHSHYFSWVHGGKLPGLYGLRDANGPSCSGGKSTFNCFSTRYMWRERGAGELYGYAPHSQCADIHQSCNHDNGKCYGYSIGRGNWTFHHDKWNHITQYVRLNTGTHCNGILKVWYDKDLVINMSNIKYRTHSDLTIDGIFFSTFFGGHDDKYASAHDTYTLFRNFQLFSSDTGPPVIG